MDFFQGRMNMKNVAFLLILAALFVTTACSSPNDSTNTLPDGHSIDIDGQAHKPGLNDPFKNCVSCHGEDLRGGKTDVSCFGCHGKKW